MWYRKELDLAHVNCSCCTDDDGDDDEDIDASQTPLAIAAYLAPHNPRATQVDPNAIPSLEHRPKSTQMQSLSRHHHLLCNSWWDNSTLKVTHPLAIALKPSKTLNAMLESCDFTLLYTFWCRTVNPLIKENRIILAVADGEVERALLKYLYCVRFLRWFTNPIPSEACLLMSLSKQWCFGLTKRAT